MKLGQQILLRIIDIVRENHFDSVKSKQILNLIDKFLPPGDTEELDLMTICKLEVLLGQELLYVPTPKQWRRIKLERLNEICNEQV